MLYIDSIISSLVTDASQLYWPHARDFSLVYFSAVGGRAL